VEIDPLTKDEDYSCDFLAIYCFTFDTYSEFPCVRERSHEFAVGYIKL